MSKESRDFNAMLRDDGSGATPQTAKENLLNMKDILGEIWDGAKPMFDHGRAELAAALFSGHAHVMYMHNPEPVEQQPNHGLPVEAPHQVEPMHKESEGREM